MEALDEEGYSVLQGVADWFEVEVGEPLVEALEVEYLLLCEGLAGGVDIEALVRVDVNELIDIPEAETENECILRFSHILRQHHLALIFFTDITHPLLRTLAGNSVLVDDNAFFGGDVRSFQFQQTHGLQ